MRKNKNTSKIVLAAIVAILATAISYSAFNNMNKRVVEQNKIIEMMQNNSKNNSESAYTYTYAVAVQNLKSGEIVSDGDIEFKEFDVLNPVAFENRSDIINKVLLQDINSGDIFTANHIAKVSGDDELKEGYRALTLPANGFQGRSNKMVVGSYIDIYSASTEDNWVLENVKIIGSSGKNNETAPLADANTITFEVSTNDISDFISNVSQSKLVLVSRNPNDKKVLRKKPSIDSVAALPNLPSTPQITNFSGLPDPMQPEIKTNSVELIEANVKTNITFD